MTPVVLLRVDRSRGGEGHPRHLHPALDLKYVQAALMRMGHEKVPLVDGWRHGGGTERWLERVMRFAPRIVVIKGASWCLAEATACAAALKQHGVTTIAVGQQVEHRLRLPDARWEECFDVALLGEPEQELPRCIAALLAANGDAWRQLLDDYRAAFAAGRRFHVADPAALPLPRFTATELVAYPFPFPVCSAPLQRWGYVMTAWGCPHACRHCTAIVRKSAQRGLQKRAPNAVADEVTALLDRGAQAISFEDDTLLADGRHFLALCEEFARRQLRFRWMANARPDEIGEDFLHAMAETGGCCLKIGVETGAPRLIETLGKAKSGAQWIAQTEAGFAALRRHRLAAVALFMVGLPGETKQDVELSLRLARRIAPDYVQVQKFTAYPDVDLWDSLPATPEADDLYHYGAAQGMHAAGISAEIMAQRQRRFYRGFYLRPQFMLDHAWRYWRHYLRPLKPGALAQAFSYLRPLRSP